MMILFGSKLTKLTIGVMALGMSVSALAYTISITEPNESRAYHRPAQTIEIEARVSPSLERGDTAAILLNDKVIADGTKANIASVDLTPGEYTITAIVMDKSAKTIAQDTQTIYVIQTNQIAKRKAAAIQARQDYDNLPWYRKAIIGINPKIQAPQKVDETTPTWEIKQDNLAP